MKLDLHLERIFPHPIEKVWAAITTAEATADCLFSCDFKPRPGHKFRFQTTPPPGSTWRGWTDMELLELEPPPRMVWAWESADIDVPT